MRILAIGATGFIGSHLIPLLQSEGHTVGILSRGNPPSGEVAHIKGDRDKLLKSQKSIESFQPDLVVDLILYTERQAREFVECFSGMVTRTVVLSSADVYRNYDGLRRVSTHQPDPVPLGENSPLRESRYPYRSSGIDFVWADDYDKILVEQTLERSDGIPAIILRLPAVYGRGDKQSRIWEYLEKMDRGEEEITLTKSRAKWRWTRGYVKNIAAAISKAISNDSVDSGVYNLGDRVTLTEMEWVEAIGHAANWNGNVVSEEETQPTDLDFSYHLETDTSRFRKTFGFEEPFKLKEALLRSIDWERSLR